MKSKELNVVGDFPAPVIDKGFTWQQLRSNFRKFEAKHHMPTPTYNGRPVMKPRKKV
jgi:hypothetical protein